MTRDAEVLPLLDAFAVEVTRLPLPWEATPAGLDAGRAILNASPQMQVAAIRAAPTLPPESYRMYSNIVARALSLLVTQLAKRNLPFTTDDVRAILRRLSSARHSYDLPAQALLRALVRPLADPEILAACRPDLERLREVAATWYASAEQRKFLRLLDEILGGTLHTPIPIHADEWGDQVRPLLDQIEPAVREPWLALLRHCTAASGSAPSGKWLATAGELVGTIGDDTFARLAAEWIGAFRKSGNKPPGTTSRGSSAVAACSSRKTPICSEGWPGPAAVSRMPHSPLRWAMRPSPATARSAVWGRARPKARAWTEYARVPHHTDEQAHGKKPSVG